MSRRLLSVVGSQARTAALVAAALALGASGAMALSTPTLVSAASSQTALDDAEEAAPVEAEPVDTEPVDTEPVDTEVADEDAAGDGDPDAADVLDDGIPPVGPVACEDAATHGEYVSSVARSTEPGPGKGAVVSAAARSDCGKPAAQPDETQGPGDGDHAAPGGPGAGAGKSTAPGQVKKAERAGAGSTTDGPSAKGKGNAKGKK